MKINRNDWFAIAFVIAFVLLVVFFPLTVCNGKVACGKLSEGLDNFGKFTNHFPYLMGFFKVGLLATFGEMLKVRMKSGSWYVPTLWARFLVWGVTGWIFTLVFALFAGGVKVISMSPVWFDTLPVIPFSKATFGQTLLFALSTSTLMNLIFAYPMMLWHEWCNMMIGEKRFIGGAEFLEKLNKGVWGSFIPKTIVFFWIPAHTVTFCLPADYRVLMSAALSLVLGAILTFHAKKA